MFRQRGLRGPAGRDRLPSPAVPTAPGSLLTPGYGQEQTQDGAEPAFEVDTRGPFAMNDGLDNAPFRELFRRSVGDFIAGHILIAATIQPNIPDPSNPYPNGNVLDEVRLVGYTNGIPTLLMVGGLGGLNMGPLAYQWSVSDDGEAFDEIGVEARQNIYGTTAAYVLNALVNDLTAVIRLWRGP